MDVLFVKLDDCCVGLEVVDCCAGCYFGCVDGIEEGTCELEER